MQIINIRSCHELDFEYVGYVCQPSAEAAALEFKAQYGVMPDVAYKRISNQGFTTIYFDLNQEHLDYRRSQSNGIVQQT